jgi:2-polyprenyl-3-methyl-5-hydroxy-6-metoxy-1,4-benzoquinol methylase
MIDSEEVMAFFKNSESYIRDNPIIELRKRIVHDLIGKPHGLQILDIGCGDGSLTIDYLGKNKITFLDITSEMIALVKTRIPNEFLENAQVKNLSIFDYKTEQEYDIIICVGVFAHISDILLLTKKLESLLKSNGIAVIQYTNSNSLVSKFNRYKNIVLFRNPYKYNLNYHSTKKIERIFLSTGLKIIQRTSYWPISPLFSLLGIKLKNQALFYFYNNKILSKQGSEKVVVVRKAPFSY